MRVLSEYKCEAAATNTRQPKLSDDIGFVAVPCNADDKDVVKVKFSNLWDTFVAHCIYISIISILSSGYSFTCSKLLVWKLSRTRLLN